MQMCPCVCVCVFIRCFRRATIPCRSSINNKRGKKMVKVVYIFLNNVIMRKSLYRICVQIFDKGTKLIKIRSSAHSTLT